eukprot:6507510-Pyramimonas_sp.AAC.1
MEGGSFQNVCRAHSFQTFARASRVEGGSFSNCRSRLSVAHAHSKLQAFHGLRARLFKLRFSFWRGACLF